VGARVAETPVGVRSRQEKIRLITLVQRAAGVVGAGYLRCVRCSSAALGWAHPRALDIRRNLSPCIYAFWHNKQVYLAVEHRGERVAVMVSKSKDGEYIAQVMNRLGLYPVRGSTRKGGDQAMREMIGLLNDQKQVAFTPDGPRGPLHMVHGGVVLAAQNTGLPVVPTTYIASRRVEFRSWDRFILPLPFGRVLVAHGRPFYVSPDAPLEQAKQQIHDALQENERAAAAAFEHAPSWAGEIFAGLMFSLYGLLLIVFSPLVAFGFAAAFGFKRGTHFLAERFSAPRLPAAAPLWFHAASVGEWQALKPVLRELRQMWPEPFCPLLITTSTPEARRLVAKEEPSLTVTMLPIDAGWIVRRWLNRVNPRALVIVETELWPNLIRASSRGRVPIFIANGRLSERSVRRWRWAAPLIRHLLFKVNGVFARGAEDAERFRRLGMVESQIETVGNTKIDNVDARSGAALLSSTTPVLIGGSTWPGEEAMLISTLQELGADQARLMIAPRKLERVAEIRALLEKSNLGFDLYSAVKAGAAWNAPVLLVDTLGDLKTLYSSANVAFVGGSVFRHGGQNPLEPASAGLPTVFGPSMSNFRDEARGLLEARAACQSNDEAGVRAHLTRLMRSGVERSQLGAAAIDHIRRQRGAAHRIARRLCDLLANT
jgi:3-deoxy-D-manno-octulosonic-acid transferase